MPNLVQELNSLDFSVYIGGPLQAAITAQQEASMTTVNFVKEVGFTLDANGEPEELRYVTFKYKAQETNPNYDPNNPASNPYIEVDRQLEVPFLTMMQIPSLRIDEVTIDFNARLASTETKDVSTSLGIDASLDINYKIVKFKASASYKRTTNTGEKVEKTYMLNVRVRAVQDELPAGLDRILQIMEGNIKGS